MMADERTDEHLKVILLANYLPDAQESMERFASVMADGLRRRGHAVRIIRPQPRLAKQNTTSGIGKWLGYVDKYVLFPSDLKQQLSWADVVHICDHSNSVYLEHMQGKPHLITCHDLLAV